MIVRLPCLGRYPVPAEGANLGLVTKLVHTKTGHFQASLAAIPLPDLPRRQMESAFTYGRRYVLSAMPGIVFEEDDDDMSPQEERLKSDHAMVEEHLHVFLMVYNFAGSLKPLKGKSPYEVVRAIWAVEP